MRKCLLAVGLLCLLFCGVFSAAQDYSKLEVFGGYSFLHADTGNTGIPNQIPAGFNADATYYFLHFLGGTADFQYHSKQYGDGMPQADCPKAFPCGTAHLINFHAGPRFKTRVGKVEPFAHALLGFTHGSFDPNGGTSFSDTAFSTKLGAGLDYAVTKRFAIRIAEANFYYTKFKPTDKFNLNGETHQNNFTLSTGIVFRP